MRVYNEHKLITAVRHAAATGRAATVDGRSRPHAKEQGKPLLWPPSHLGYGLRLIRALICVQGGLARLQGRAALPVQLVESRVCIMSWTRSRSTSRDADCRPCGAMRMWMCVFMCLYTCMCGCTRAPIYVYVHVVAHTYVCVHVFGHVYACEHACV